MSITQWLQHIQSSENGKIIFLLSMILIANMLDFVFGWVNAKLNPNVKFSSSKAVYGIGRKMCAFIVCVFFIPVSSIVPYPIGIGALYVLFTGYLFSEINSILNHFKLADDDKTSDLFISFIASIIQNKKGDK